ncbi:MAG: UDP-N-acetylmuramoyl-tripeptide--D-alanyl-D-alanine ligase [Patescibacteria group bacterium]
MLLNLLHGILRRLAKDVLNKYHPDIFGITGSIGKSSTKEAIACVLGSRFKVRANYKNYNNEIGVPLTILGVNKSPGRSLFGWLSVFMKGLGLIWLKNDYPDILVLEMGADKPGDIQYLIELAPCKVGVLTYISLAHTELFKTLKRIAQEKRIIISHLKRDGFAILNFDSPLVMENANVTKAEKITYGFRDGADLQATDVNVITNPDSIVPAGLNFKVNYKGNIVPVFLSGFVSRSAIPAALAGLAGGLINGINLVEGAEALRNLLPMPGHMRPIAGIKNTLLIDDTYNSSPEPTRTALETLAEINLKIGAQRYAVLADMLELGAETQNAHREIGLRVAELGIDFLITVGEASKHTALSAREAGLVEHRIASFADSITAGKFLQEKLHEGDVVLVKGSQSMRMEKIVKEVMAEPELAKDLLARQGEEWK